MPLADEGAELVGGEVEAVEVGQAVLALDFVDSELDLAESVVLILLEIGKRNFEYPALQSVVCILETSGAVDEGLADAVDTEKSECVPLGEYEQDAEAGGLTLGSGKFLGP